VTADVDASTICFNQIGELHGVVVNVTVSPLVNVPPHPAEAIENRISLVSELVGSKSADTEPVPTVVPAELVHVKEVALENVIVYESYSTPLLFKSRLPAVVLSYVPPLELTVKFEKAAAASAVYNTPLAIDSVAV
jgi:hypothetical protein